MSTVAEKMLVALRAAGRDGLDVEDLPEQLETTRSGVTRAVKKLEGDGRIVQENGRIRAVLRVGRRLISTVERDQAVLEAIRATGPSGSSLLSLVEITGYPRSKAYQSVWRLARAGEVRRSGMTRTARWVAVSADREVAA